jgi:type II secretory pathway pseudopilin PulG
MEINALPTLILTFVLVGLLIGVGLVTFSNFSDAVAVTSTITAEEITWVADTETIALAHGNITTFSRIINATNDVVDPTNYSVDLTTGVITANDQITCAEGETCYADYTYKEYATPTDTALDSVTTEVGNISTNWLGLIITIMVMAIILGIVLSSFGTRMRN